MLARSKRLTRKIERSGLCLTRKDGEEIRLQLPDGRFAYFTILEGKVGRARIKVTAPDDCPILRTELVPEETAA